MCPHKPRALVALLSTLTAVLAAGAGAAPATASPDGCYFPSSFFCQRLAPDAPIDPHSAAMVTELRNMAYGVDPHNPFDCRRAVLTDNIARWTEDERQYCQKLTYRAGINYDAYAPMAYTVAADQGRVPVILDRGDAGLRAAFSAGVPIPPHAQAASGTDGQLIIYQPSSDTMWELWRARKDLAGVWRATYGGVIVGVSKNPGHYEDVQAPFQSHTWGGPSSSIPNLPGLMTLEQLRSGVIGHALVFSTWANNPSHWVYPAQRTDGRCQGPASQYCADVPQGARFRLDPNFDVGQIQHPVTRMIAKAVQDYGMVLNNTTGAGLNFYAEGWRGHQGVTDPYYGPGGLFASDPQQTASTQFLREFPWERLQMLQRGTTCSNALLQCEQPAGWPFAGSGTAATPSDASPASERVTLKRPRITRRRVIAAGTIAPALSGSVEVSFRRIGADGFRKVKLVALRDGRFRTTFPLPEQNTQGRYRLIASYPGDASHMAARAKRTLRVG